MAWSIDWWSVLGWAGFGIGLVVAAWALLWDRARGRLRCPKCWYDMTGAKQEESDALRCPECGRQVRRKKELRRTRRRWRWGIPAVFVMAIGLIAGTMHDPAGVRSRGWAALIPTPVLVVVAPVDNLIIAHPHFRGSVTWNSDPADPLAKELGFRLTSGRMSASLARVWFWRVDRGNTDFVEHAVGLGLPRYVGGDLHISARFDISHEHPRPSMSTPNIVDLPSRERIVGAVAGEWVHRCKCSIGTRRGAMIGAELEPGRYIVEREFYLPDPWHTSGGFLTRMDGQAIYASDRRVWTVRREVVISESTIDLMMPFDAPGVGDELVRQLDPVVGIDEHNRVWYLRKHLVDPLTKPWRDIAFGMSVRIFKDGAEVGTGTIHAWNPNPATRQPDLSGWDNLYNMHRNWLRNDGALAVGDLMTVVLEGAVEIAGERPGGPPEYWSGRVVLEDVIVQEVPGSLPISYVRGTFPPRPVRVTVPPMEE